MKSTLSFDDVLLVPQYSDIESRKQEVSLASTLGQITTQIPVISSPMDTVTEGTMAQAMDDLGGLGIIHYNMPIEDQVAEVRKVKTYKNGFISDPVVLAPHNTLSDLDAVK